MINADCGDGNVCTDDICNGVFQCENNPNTDPCDSGLACSVNDTCSAGICQPGADDNSLCDDTDLCTTDVCTAGSCVFQPEPDTDADGVCDLIDNCVFRPNPLQEDEGNVGPSGPPMPDGIGDVCQCGDITFNHFVDFFDAVGIRMYRIETSTPSAADLERCSARGPADSCDPVDEVVIARVSEPTPLGPGVTQDCRAAVGP